MPETGWYFNAAETGRGYFIEAQGTNIFLGAFMYASSGQAVWYVLSNPAVVGDTTVINGPLLTCSNGQTLTGAYRAPGCNATADQLTLQFSNPFTAILSLPTGSQVTLSRFTF
jgi:hypothetical protein